MALNQTLLLSELFYSLQGESTHTGLPCVFIRLSGCNLRCSYCDTGYSYDENGKSVAIDSIISFVNDYEEALVEITGGEPLLQENSYLLLDELIQNKRKILLETNGSLAIDRIPIEVCTIIDIKCPGSGYETSFLQENLLHIKKRAAIDRHSVEIKFVISNLADYRWAKQFILEHELIHCAPVLFSPVTSSVTATELGERILTDQLQVRLQVQLHTLLWPEKKRGI